MCVQYYYGYIVDQNTGVVLGVEDIIQIVLWDFAGQFVFLTTHQTYLSDRCIFFLVFDMTKELDETVEEEDTVGTSRKTVLGSIDICIINSRWDICRGGFQERQMIDIINKVY